jgi:ABC-type Fe3+ transport system substrate-binding protein
MNRSRRSAIWISLVALVVAACSPGASPSPSSAASPAASSATSPSAAGSTSPAASSGGASIESVCEAAAAEGTLVQWGGSDEEVATAFYDVFAETYPGIEYEYLSIRPSEGAQRLISESALGQPVTVDLVSFEPNTLVGMIERDLVDQDVDWTGLGVDEALVTDQGAVLWSRNGQAITYNTELVDEATLPDTWEELIDPQWADGKIVVDPRGRPFDKLSLVWGEEQTLDYVERLKAIGPAIIEGGTAGMVAVGSGEAMLTTGGLTIETQEQQAVGAPLEIKYLDVVTTEDAIVSVLEGAPHPNAAICYSVWLASDEGQEAVNEINFGGAVLEGLPPDSVVRSIETDAEAEQVAAMSEKINEIWTSP